MAFESSSRLYCQRLKTRSIGGIPLQTSPLSGERLQGLLNKYISIHLLWVGQSASISWTRCPTYFTRCDYLFVGAP